MFVKEYLSYHHEGACITKYIQGVLTYNELYMFNIVKGSVSQILTNQFIREAR